MTAARTAAIEAALAVPRKPVDAWRRRADNLREKGKSPSTDEYADRLRPWFPEADQLAATLVTKDAVALARHRA
ncbi:hypothetical protein [Longispora albida]|uniref:hypothetical protein n=1 Tax=Longispora albida TaxID=203523 RepID=UPI00037B6743|nr:hypothetical protein [Longispora albida]